MEQICFLYKLYIFIVLLTLPIVYSTRHQYQYDYRNLKPLNANTNSLGSREQLEEIYIFDEQKHITKSENDPSDSSQNRADEGNKIHDLSNNPLPQSQTDRDEVMMNDNKNQIHSSMELEEGSFCRRSFDGRSGYCILSYQCLHAMKDYREHGVKIDICTYRRNVPIICCPLAEKHVEYQSISAKKCLQYNNAIEGVQFGIPRKISGKTCEPSLPMIVGGQVVNEGEYPHMAALGWTQDTDTIFWGCGGTLISELYILTAAHCATSGEKPPDIVRLGAPNLNDNSTHSQTIPLANIILHPSYRTSSYYHDIGLIKLARQVNISTRVRPACLWQLPDIDISTMVATGWGRTSFRGRRTTTLQKVDLNMINQNLCKKLYFKERRLPKGILEEQFCAGHLDGGKDTCQGDSGGPLHAELAELRCVKFVVGITSFGKFCAQSNAPGVYLKVYPYLDWIESIAFKEN